MKVLERVNSINKANFTGNNLKRRKKGDKIRMLDTNLKRKETIEITKVSETPNKWRLI